jgi:hypothetical protein
VCLYRVDRPLLPSPSTGKTNLSGTFLRAVSLTLYLVFFKEDWGYRLQLGVVLRLQLRNGALCGGRGGGRGMITKCCKVIFHTTTTDQTRDECPESSVTVDISLKARTLYITLVFR